MVEMIYRVDDILQDKNIMQYNKIRKKFVGNSDKNTYFL